MVWCGVVWFARLLAGYLVRTQSRAHSLTVSTAVTNAALGRGSDGSPDSLSPYLCVCHSLCALAVFLLSQLCVCVRHIGIPMGGAVSVSVSVSVRAASVAAALSFCIRIFQFIR